MKPTPKYCHLPLRCVSIRQVSPSGRRHRQAEYSPKQHVGCRVAVPLPHRLALLASRVPLVFGPRRGAPHLPAALEACGCAVRADSPVRQPLGLVAVMCACLRWSVFITHSDMRIEPIFLGRYDAGLAREKYWILHRSTIHLPSQFLRGGNLART